MVLNLGSNDVDVFPRLEKASDQRFIGAPTGRMFVGLCNADPLIMESSDTSHC